MVRAQHVNSPMDTSVMQRRKPSTQVFALINPGQQRVTPTHFEEKQTAHLGKASAGRAGKSADLQKHVTDITATDQPRAQRNLPFAALMEGFATSVTVHKIRT
eukprot:6482096-Amphidinium_carterae.2